MAEKVIRQLIDDIDGSDAARTRHFSVDGKNYKIDLSEKNNEKFDKALGESVPGAGFGFSQPIEMNTNDLLAGISSDLALHLYGNDLAELRQTADHIVRTLKNAIAQQRLAQRPVAGGIRCSRRGVRKARGKYTGPVPSRGCASRRRARRDGAPLRAESAGRR